MTQNEHVYPVSSQQEVAGDAISAESVKAIEGYSVLNFEPASFSSYRENQNQPFA